MFEKNNSIINLVSQSHWFNNREYYIIEPNNSFSIDFNNLLIKYPSVDPNSLGLLENWNNEELWKEG